MTINRDVTRKPLMCDKGDVEAVANHRVAKANSKTSNRLAIIMLIFALAGYFVYSRINLWAGVALFGVAAVILIWRFYFVIPKQQKIKKEELVKAWREQKW